MKRNNCAETVDRMQRGVAWGMLLCGITYLVIIAEDLTPKGTLNNILDMITMAGVVVTMGITLVAIWPALKQKMSGQLNRSKEPESFLSGAMLESFKNGWIASTLSIVVLLSVSSRLELLELPIRFYFTALFAIAVLSVSISFFWLTREDDLESMEE